MSNCLNSRCRTVAAAAILSMFAVGQSMAGGVTDDRIVVGLITDLSGPTAQYGKESLAGMTMALEEVNAAGGVNGRKIELKVEDHGYDPRRAVLAAQKLVIQDQVFAVLGHLGTPTNMAALPVVIDNGVFNFMPQGAAPGLYDPPSPYKVAHTPSHFDIAASSLQWLLQQQAYQRICVFYQDDDYGREALQGVTALLSSQGKEIAEQTSYKRGATDFSSQIARLKAASCDLVYSASTLREFVGSMVEARKVGFAPAVLSGIASYAIQAPGLGGDAMEGAYSASFLQIPYADDPNPAVRDWVGRYMKQFGEAPGLFAMNSYYAMRTFATIAAKTGSALTAESFAQALNEVDLPADELGNPPFDISPEHRISNDKVRVMRIEKGRWVAVSDLIAPPALQH